MESVSIDFPLAGAEFVNVNIYKSPVAYKNCNSIFIFCWQLFNTGVMSTEARKF